MEAMELDSAMDDEARQVLSDICIPPCPAILTKVMQEMRGDDPDFRKIGILIGGDASLSAAMLQTVNSPFYGLRSKATSVQQAVALLGLRNVVQVVTGLLLRNAFPACDGELLEDYWDSSSAIARINAVLARKFKGPNSDEAHTFALFRDCGMLAMMDAYKDYVPVFAGAETEDSRGVTSVENERHHIDHARIGYNLAKIWLLPEEICQAVLWHHDYSVLQGGQAGISAGATRHIALALAAEWMFVKRTMGIDSPEWLRGGDFALALLGVELSDLDAIRMELSDDICAS